MGRPKFKPKYRYQMHNTGESSAKYGDCEVCRKHVSEVWLQIEERTYAALPGEKGPFWTRAGCVDLFGHKKCLLSKRRKRGTLR
jgi:hypothetical protein